MQVALQGVPRGQAAGPGDVDVGLEVLHLAGRHGFPQADRLAQRADVHEEIAHRRLDVDRRPRVRGARDLGELDAEVNAVGRGLVGRVLDLQRLDEADVQLAPRLVDEQPQEPLAVAVQAADGLLLPPAPLVPLAEVLERLAAVVEHRFAGRMRIARQHVVGVSAAHGVGHAVAGGADRVRVRLGEDPRTGRGFAAARFR